MPTMVVFPINASSSVSFVVVVVVTVVISSISTSVFNQIKA